MQAEPLDTWLGAALVAKATSAALLAPDWGLNTDVVDAVNQGWGDHGKDVVKAVRAQVAQPQPRVALLALELLAALMHNCGTQLHECVARKGVLQEITRQAGRSADAEVRNKCLELVHAWGQVRWSGQNKFARTHAHRKQSVPDQHPCAEGRKRALRPRPRAGGHPCGPRGATPGARPRILREPSAASVRGI